MHSEKKGITVCYKMKQENLLPKIIQIIRRSGNRYINAEKNRDFMKSCYTFQGFCLKPKEFTEFLLLEIQSNPRLHLIHATYWSLINCRKCESISVTIKSFSVSMAFSC